MLQNYSTGHLANPSARVLALPLQALAACPADLLSFTEGMPVQGHLLPTCNLILPATSFDSPLVRLAVTEAARMWHYSVLLVRSGLHPEGLDPVLVDVSIAGAPVGLHDLAFYRHTDASLWLVPTETSVSHCLEIDEAGVSRFGRCPYADADERSDGLCRAVAEIVRLARTGRTGR
ncbi:hypothetical protein [Croceibacterium mercuriale]|uniref:hypothetical protein n=1 Tax=Croceibacterium mercuriale TaxID=1572751 RepID=UPI001269C8A0|nr:hypothetical protein [Croceibacterium mercuriale]